MNRETVLSETNIIIDKKNINVTKRELSVLSARTHLFNKGEKVTQKEIANLLCSNNNYDKLKESSVKQIVRDLKNKLGIQGNIADIIYELNRINVPIPAFIENKR